MVVNGGDCSIVIKTAYREMEVLYIEETIREAVSFLREEAALEGSGLCGGVLKGGGVTGCVVTPLDLGSAPLLLYLAFGGAGLPLFVSETRNVYQYRLNLLPAEDSGVFDLVQWRGGERRVFEGCRAAGFELRLDRGRAVRLKLDVRGGLPPVIYPYSEIPSTEPGERFSGDGVCYRINGTDYGSIYGLTLSAKKEGGCRTELWIKRALQAGADLPGVIEELVIEARLLRDGYEERYFGMFRIRVRRLVLVADETRIDCTDGVIGPLRYYVAGAVSAEVFNASGEGLA